jgi:hypothetical protein
LDVGGGYGFYHDWSIPAQALPSLPTLVGSRDLQLHEASQTAQSASEATEESTGKEQQIKKENK